MNMLVRYALALGGAVALSLPAASAAAAPAPATDGQISINTGSGWTHNPTTPLFDATDIVPGWASTATLGVRNDSDQSTALSVKAANVVDEENGCNQPESLVDTTCTGADTGELSKEVVLSVFADPDNEGTFSTSPTWTGTIDALEQGATLQAQLPAGATTTYKIDAELPSTSGNETQSDRVAFDMIVRLDGEPGGVAVEGTKITRTPGTGIVDRIASDLPFTGAPAMRLAAAALWLILAGIATLLLAARRRRMGPA